MRFIVKRLRWSSPVGLALFAGLLLVVTVWLSLGFTPQPLLVNRANGSYAVTDRDGRLLRLSLTSDEKYRLWTPLAELPQTLRDATLRYEDRWFYRHPGINPVSLLRAAWSSLIVQERWIGASTLTMQLARQRWRLKTSSLSGKLRQMAYALWLERQFSKDELLEAYLNIAPYGANIEGVAAAAWIYFHKPASELNRDEARALALIPQNPSARAPMNQAARQRLRQAWRLAYGNEPGFERLWFRQRSDLPFRAPHFAERLHDLYPEAATLVSTLDGTLQSLSETLLAGFLRQHRLQGIANATVMVVHAPSMAVRAYLGSADYFNRRIQGFVNGLKALRSPGSTLKPFIYAQAIAQGLITPDSRVKDTPLRMGYYQPENFERNFYGPLSATDALVRSRNIPAISLLAQLEKPTFHAFLLQAGIAIPKQAANYGLSLAIGSAEISMEDLLRLYGLLANRGRLQSLHWLRDAGPDTGQAPMLPEAAFLVREMLENNPRPQRSFGGRSFGQQQVVAWKTGTSSGLKDAWAIGMMGDWLVGVWAGNFDGSPNSHLVGRELLGPLLFDIFDAIAIERPVAAAEAPPAGLKRIDVCALSGQPISRWCPYKKTGWMIPGVSPIQACTLHRPIRINPVNGLRQCPEEESAGETRVAEFWDSDELEAFRQSGVRRDIPPAFERPCAQISASDAATEPPKIVSPQAGVSYPVRAGQPGSIEFSAVSSAGKSRLFWFVDDHFAGEGATLLWPAKPGNYQVVVVDGQGRASTVELTAMAAK
ncbi:MAG: penicillin-binding protein 1C [Methylomonas sp.]|uniref:penicillin-binding protein 1C n=1 Tax=Methylomonas sp. TaxID=418 RepID=UPI0025FF9E47|nr:penicillin-binding protein 1C [Methylomonas sp.]MCK9605064.1 penicillin-binding protein 1C [Methylomonas sp.]